jgi:hypothetical protein
VELAHDAISGLHMEEVSLTVISAHACVQDNDGDTSGFHVEAVRLTISG